MTIAPSGASGITWNAEPDFENDGSNLDGLEFYQDLYNNVTFESTSGYIIASTNNVLYPRAGIILPELEGAFAKCLIFEIYAPAAQAFVQVQPGMGHGLGPELTVGNAAFVNEPYNLPSDQGVMSNMGYFAISPIPTPFTFDTWHTLRFVSLAGSQTAFWMDDELLVSEARAYQRPELTIFQLKVPPTANKATHSLRIRNIRAWSAKTGAPNHS